MVQELSGFVHVLFGQDVWQIQFAPYGLEVNENYDASPILCAGGLAMPLSQPVL